MTTTATVPALGYLRVSTDRQALEVHTSLADQKAAIEQLAAQLDTAITEWYRDEGASGATVEGRPAFQALLAYCAEHARSGRRQQPGLVLVLNASRFGRWDDAEESAYWRVHLRKLGWIVRFAQGDVEGDAAPIMRAVSDVEASQYRKNLRANSRRGMKGAASQGFWTREAPYAFRRQVVFPESAARVLELGQLKAPNEKVKLVPHEEEAKVVRWIYESYVSRTHSAYTLVRELKQRVPHRRWSAQVIAALIRNPAYCGDVVGGRRRGETDRSHLRAVDLYGMRDAHPAIVSRELWDAAQARMAENRKLGRAVHSTYLLTGVLGCPYCDGHYVGGGGGRSRDRKPVREKRRFYRDAGGLDGRCPGRIGTVMRHIVEDATVRLMTKTIRSGVIRRRLERRATDVLSGARGGPAESEAALRSALRRAESRRERLISLVLDGTVRQGEAAAQLELLRAEIERLNARIDATRFVARRQVPRRDQVEQVLRAIDDFPRLVARSSGQDLRRLVLMWVQRATFDKVTRDLELAFRPVPLSYLQRTSSLAPDDQLQGLHRPLIRRVNLIQPGYSVDVHQLRRTS